MWCRLPTSKNDEQIQSIVQDEHSPNAARVLGSLRNSPDFAEAWNCPAGSPMNPTQKCTMWWMFKITSSIIAYLTIIIINVIILIVHGLCIIYDNLSFSFCTINVIRNIPCININIIYHIACLCIVHVCNITNMILFFPL